MILSSHSAILYLICAKFFFSRYYTISCLNFNFFSNSLKYKFLMTIGGQSVVMSSLHGWTGNSVSLKALIFHKHHCKKITYPFRVRKRHVAYVNMSITMHVNCCLFYLAFMKTNEENKIFLVIPELRGKKVQDLVEISWYYNNKNLSLTRILPCK